MVDNNRGKAPRKKVTKNHSGQSFEMSSTSREGTPGKKTTAKNQSLTRSQESVKKTKDLSRKDEVSKQLRDEM